MQYDATKSLARNVLGVVVTNGLTPYLHDALASVTSQTVAPARLLVVDVSAKSVLSSADIDSVTGPGAHSGVAIHIIAAPKAKTFGQAVNAALAGVGHSEPWLWLLHDDAEALPTALEQLLRSVEHSSNVSIVGAKQRKLDHGKELINVGYTASRQGTYYAGLHSQEFDQGQHDFKDDVYAVSLNGALVSAEVWNDLKGTVNAFGKYLDSADFCRRARLAGHRVIVQSEAVVLHAQATLMDVRESDQRVQTPSPTVLDDEPLNSSFWDRLKSSLLFGVTNHSLLAFPFVWLMVLVLAPLRMLYRIFTKAPGKALWELVAPFWLLLQFPQVSLIRSRMSRGKKVSSAASNSLLATPRNIFDDRRNKRLAKTALRKKLYGPNEFDRRELQALARKRATVFTLVTLAVVGLSVYAFRDFLPALTSQRSLVGGAMLSTQGGWSELWQHWTSGWIRDGLGASAPSDPLLTTLAPLMVLTVGNMQLAANIVFIGSLVGSAIGAWFAAGTITRSVTARAWSAFIWTAAPTLLFSVEQGRMGAVIAHSALPWLAVAVMRGIGANKRDERSALRYRHERRAEAELEIAGIVANNPTDGARRSLAAIGGAALLFAVVTAGAPVLLVPGVLVFVCAGLFTRARALLVVPIPAIAMLGPVLFRGYVNREADGWRVLFTDPGGIFGFTPSQPWERALGVPAKISEFSMAQGFWPAFVLVLPYLLGGALLVGALFALLRRGPRVNAIRMAWWVAVLGLATSFASTAVVVAAGDTGAVFGWSGAGISLMTFGLLAACLLASDELAATALNRSFGWRQISLGFAGLLVFLIPATTLAVWGLDRDIAHETTAGGETAANNLMVLDRSVVPAVATQMQTGGRQARVLAISPGGVGQVSYQLMHGNGVQMMETSTVVDLAYLTGRPDDIAGLVAHLARGLEQEGNAASSFQLAAMGVGAVLVPTSDSEESAQLIGRIDSVAGLQRITENETGTVWRVDPSELDQALALGEFASVQAQNKAALEAAEAAKAAQDEAPGADASTQEPGDLPLSQILPEEDTAKATTTILAADPAWAVSYTLDSNGILTDPIQLEASRLEVSTAWNAAPSDRVILLAENDAPGWQATIGDTVLQRTTFNGMQGFEVPAGTAGPLDINYERSSRIMWLSLQSAVLIVFGVLAIPVRRKGASK